MPLSAAFPGTDNDISEGPFMWIPIYPCTPDCIEHSTIHVLTNQERE